MLTGLARGLVAFSHRDRNCGLFSGRQWSPELGPSPQVPARPSGKTQPCVPVPPQQPRSGERWSWRIRGSNTPKAARRPAPRAGARTLPQAPTSESAKSASSRSLALFRGALSNWKSPSLGYTRGTWSARRRAPVLQGSRRACGHPSGEAVQKVRPGRSLRRWDGAVSHRSAAPIDPRRHGARLRPSVSRSCRLPAGAWGLNASAAAGPDRPAPRAAGSQVPE